MSGLAARVRWDGGAAREADVAPALDLLAARGPDGVEAGVHGPAALGLRRFRTTPESVAERQPHGDERAGVWLVFDGRLDDRAALAKALTSAGVPPQEDTDAELVLRGYLAWGPALPERLLGDFALALWDAPRARLLCARDALGVRSLAWQASAGCFACASEPGAVLALTAEPAMLDEGVVAERLANQWKDRETTLWRGVRRLPPGHALVADAHGVRTWRWWRPETLAPLVGLDDADYAARLRVTLESAVADRLRALGPVGIDLSGGLDSSSVAVVAAALARAGRGAPAGLTTYSLVFPGWSCDETPWIAAVERASGLPARRVPWRPPDPRLAREAASSSRDLICPPNGLLALGTCSVAGADGVRVALSGKGGDEWFTGSGARGADLLRAGRVGAALREAQWLARRGPRGLLAAFLRGSVAPLFRTETRMALRRLAGRGRPPPWIHPRLANRTGLAERLLHETDSPGCNSAATAWLLRMAMSPFHEAMLELMDRDAAATGMEYRHPFLDRRVVELGLRLPDEQRRRGGLTKDVLRRAMADLLPAEVLSRRDKANFTQPVMRALRGWACPDDSLTALASQGWIRREPAERLLARGLGVDAQGRPAVHGGLATAWAVLALEGWTRQLLGWA